MCGDYLSLFWMAHRSGHLALSAAESVLYVEAEQVSTDASYGSR